MITSLYVAAGDSCLFVLKCLLLQLEPGRDTGVQDLEPASHLRDQSACSIYEGVYVGSGTGT